MAWSHQLESWSTCYWQWLRIPKFDLCSKGSENLQLTNRTSLWQSALFLSHKCLPSFDVFGHSALLDACGLGILSWVVQEQFLTINPNLTFFSLLTTLKTWRPNEKSGEQWLWSLHLFCETSAALKLRLSMVSYNAALGSCTKAGFWKRMCSCADVQLVCYVFTFLLVVLYFLEVLYCIHSVGCQYSKASRYQWTVCLSFLITQLQTFIVGAGLKT